MLLCKNISRLISHINTCICIFCRTMHKGAHVCSMYVALCLCTHSHLFSWYSLWMLFWWCCRCMWWVVLCLCVKNVTQAFRCYLYSFQLWRQEAPLISLVSCPLKSRVQSVCSIFLFVSDNLRSSAAFPESFALIFCLQPISLTKALSCFYTVMSLLSWWMAHHGLM